MSDEPRGEMTVREAGRRGGETVKAKYGQGFYETIGQKGGTKTAERGAEYYSQIGHKGGSVTAERHGQSFYEAIGRKGGARVRELILRAQEAEEVERAWDAALAEKPQRDAALAAKTARDAAL